MLTAKSPPDGTLFTYADYITWPSAERWEVIEGIAYVKEGGTQAMSPAPSRRHQAVLVELTRIIANYLKGKPCHVYCAPFDVRFPKAVTTHKEAYSVVQPDLVVVCDIEKLDDHGCIGAPNWIIEIISPGSAQMDYVKKSRHAVQRS